MNNEKSVTINIEEIPVESSLGLLAYGDIAFEAWRKKKIEMNKKMKDEEK